jgi:hypothetical protein
MWLVSTKPPGPSDSPGVPAAVVAGTDSDERIADYVDDVDAGDDEHPRKRASNEGPVSCSANASTTNSAAALGPSVPVVIAAHGSRRFFDHDLSPTDLPAVVLGRLLMMLSHDDAALLSYGLTPNNGTILLRGGESTSQDSAVRSSSAGEVRTHWYHAEVVAGRVIVNAEFSLNGDEIVDERISAIAVDAVRRVSIKDGSGSITYLEGAEEMQVSVDPLIATATIRARAD